MIIKTGQVLVPIDLIPITSYYKQLMCFTTIIRPLVDITFSSLQDKVVLSEGEVMDQDIIVVRL